MAKNTKIRPKNSIQTILRLFSYLKFHKYLFFSALLFVIASSIAQIIFNGLLSPVIDILISGDLNNKLKSYMIIMAILTIITSLGQYVGSILMAKTAQVTIHKIRQDMMEHMSKMPISFFDKTKHGDLMSTYTNDIDTLTQSLEQSLSQITIATITVFGSFVAMLFISPLLTIIVALILAGIVYLAGIVGKKSAKNYRDQQMFIARANAFTEEMISGQKEIKIYGQEVATINEFKKYNQDIMSANVKASTYGSMTMPIMNNLSYAMYSLVSMVGAIMVLNKSFSIGNIASFLQYTRLVSRPIAQVANQLNSLFASLAGAERIFNVLDQPLETDEGSVHISDSDRESYWTNKDNNKLSTIQGHIRFKNVSFSYDGVRPTLKNIELYAKPGQTIAFVGSTGAGKSTIINLINRFYDYQEGAILYDNIDIKNIKKHDLRSTISTVLQDVHLFEGSIADNIRYGKLDASDEEVISAAQLANADYFINNLPDKYNTKLTIDGTNLSQGERQLISIARAAIANPTVLILDEATSSVDTMTENLIAKGMDKLMQDRTTLVIAHRLSTVRNANAIIVLENGEIIERGDHDDLIKQKGKYYELNTGQAHLS